MLSHLFVIGVRAGGGREGIFVAHLISLAKVDALMRLLWNWLLAQNACQHFKSNFLTVYFLHWLWFVSFRFHSPIEAHPNQPKCPFHLTTFAMNAHSCLQLFDKWLLWNKIDDITSGVYCLPMPQAQRLSNAMVIRLKFTHKFYLIKDLA